MLKGEIDLDGKLVTKPLCHLKIMKRLIFFISIDEHYDAGSIVVQEADVSNETHKKLFNKVKRNDYGKRSNSFDGKVVRYLSRNCYIPNERAN